MKGLSMNRSRLSVCIRYLFATCFCLLLVGSQAAQPAIKKRPLTVEDLWNVKRLGKPSLSPDGKWAVVEVTTYDIDKNDGTSDLWLVATDGKTQKQLTTHTAKDSGPVWSPDGKHIAFVSKRGGDDTAQIYLISPEGGEARRLTKMPMNPSGLKWSPDSKTVYCIASTWPDTPDDASFKKKEKERKDSKVQAYVIDDALFRAWDTWIADGKRPVLFSVNTTTGEHKNLFTKTKLFLPIFQPSATAYDISPDGKEICFTAETTKEIGTDSNSDLYVMPSAGSLAPKNITVDNPANDGTPAYSPDGKWIAFTRQTIKFFYADRIRIMRHDRKSGKNIEMTGKFDRSCGSPRWGQDSTKLVFDAEVNGYHRIFAVQKPDDELLTNVTSGFSDYSFDLCDKHNIMVFLRTSFDLPAALFKLNPGEEVMQIDSFNKTLVEQWELGKVKEVYYVGADDHTVHMWIVYPPNFDPKKKWPLLMVVHGGPHNGITTDFHYRWNAQLQAAKGYVVAIPNFHGSSGFGQKFTDSITGDMATKPFTDVMKATDYMTPQPYIDKNRLAAAGASYGGFMMAWLNGHTDRFKAMVCHAGVYNWHSQMASDIVRARERALGAMPWGDITKIDKQSPQRFAANFKTPTLIMHGEKDYRVPVTQGFEYYNTLRLKGVPTRLVYFPDENHWILKPQNSLLWHREFFGWLEKYVGSGPTK
jgi:dipeptidyl aminopeptidase/acylaminoacyl peptidase